MSNQEKIKNIRSIINTIIPDIQKNRDKLTIIGFKGQTAELIISPTKRPTAFLNKINEILIGGTTPLATAMQKGLEIALPEKRQNQYIPIIITLTDGMPNVALKHTPTKDAIEIAKKLDKEKIHTIFIDFDNTQKSGRNLNMDLSIHAHGHYYDINNISNQNIALKKIINYERNNI